jgi:hypothetical protein
MFHLNTGMFGRKMSFSDPVLPKPQAGECPLGAIWLNPRRNIERLVKFY